MADRGWRKRLQDKRPKTPVPTKAIGEKATTHEPTDKAAKRGQPQPLDKSGWRKTLQSSRTDTPFVLPPTLSVGDDAEDRRSETGSDVGPTPSKNGPRPKVSRYFSDYLTLATTPKILEFYSEPWDESPFAFVPPVDPVAVIPAVRSHINNFPRKPIPVGHNTGILGIFEAYRTVRQEKELLDNLLQETLEKYRVSEEVWATAEGHYQEEVRRLELIIARGRSGMAELMKARQGTVVDRKRRHRKTLSTDRPTVGYLTREQLDEQIRVRSQQVVFHRPFSPSGRMAALSRHFSTSGGAEELPMGTPPAKNQKISLSRKVKSELNLSNVGELDASSSVSQSFYSGFSGSGDALPDEIEAQTGDAVDLGVESEAFVALRDLAILVARRRGINVENFLSGLMKLYSTVEEDVTNDMKTDSHTDTGDLDELQPVEKEQNTSQLLERRMRRFRSQTQLTAGKIQRRHFSFEPGDDQLGALNEKLQRLQFIRPRSPAGSQSTRSSESHDQFPDALFEASDDSFQALRADTPKPSKIPSPLQTMGRVRRENSTSSLQTITKMDSRRDSRSSIMTAFRESSSGNLWQPQSGSRSNSINNLRQTEGQHTRERTGSLGLRNSVAALAAARTASSSASDSKSISPMAHRRGKSSASSSGTTSAATKRGGSSENDIPQTR